VASAGALALLTGCGGGPVDVAVPAMEPDQVATCAALVAALPDTVDDLPRREVEPADAPAAAWGDPAIVLRCGVPVPDGFTDTSMCLETDGVGWFVPDEQLDGTAETVTMTTIGRDVNVEVTLPEGRLPAYAMVDLAPAVKRTTELLDPCV
jgi:hypothetical protein